MGKVRRPYSSEDPVLLDFDATLARLIAEGKVMIAHDANGEEVIMLTEKGRERNRKNEDRGSQH
jgi:hypothetical protein